MEELLYRSDNDRYGYAPETLPSAENLSRDHLHRLWSCHDHVKHQIFLDIFEDIGEALIQLSGDRYLLSSLLITLYSNKGEVPEWLNGAVSKTVVPKGTQGSNPCLSAIYE